MSIQKIRRLAPALLLAALACLAIVSPTLALDINPAEYFSVTYEPITFDRSEVAPEAVFHTTIIGQAACYKTIPLPVSRATIVSQVVARRADTGASYPLNPGFTIDIDPFPDKAGETYDINVPLDLVFPEGTPPGDYEVIWQPTEARARVSFVWTDVTDYFPAEQPMGTVTVDAAASSPAATTTPPPTDTPTVPAIPPPTTFTLNPPDTAPAYIPWLILMVVGAIVLAAVIVIVVVFVLRRR